MSSILPREGLTLEAFCSPFYHTLFQPFLTGPLLYGLLKYPDVVQQWSGSASLVNRHGILGVGILFGLGILTRVDGWLSRLAVNNYSSDSTWDWKKEIILLTGGSSGIGAKIATKLAEGGSQVVILDISPPSWTIRTKCLSFFKPFPERVC